MKIFAMFNMEKFSFAQMVSNANGKTSATATMGVLICTIGAISFLMGVIDIMFFTNSADILTQSIMFTSLGAGLLGVNKWVGMTKDIMPTTEEPTKQETTQINS